MIEIFTKTKSWRNFLKGLKQKLGIFMGSKNIFNLNLKIKVKLQGLYTCCCSLKRDSMVGHITIHPQGATWHMQSTNVTTTRSPIPQQQGFFLNQGHMSSFHWFSRHLFKQIHPLLLRCQKGLFPPSLLSYTL